MSLAKKELFGIGITDAKKEEVLEYIVNSLEKPQKPYYIVTPNPEIVVAARQSSSLKSALNAAEIALCDGVGLYLASKLLGRPIKERIAGVDFMESVCKESVRIGKERVRKPVAVGFLGGRRGVAEKTAECLMRKYPGLSIGFIAEEWGQHGFDTAKKLQVESIASHKMDSIDILFVAFGFPKQEEWMQAHIGKIPVTAMMGVGGAFDYIAGTVSRAPRFIRSVGLEWLYRLIRQPWRLKRQVALINFLLLTLRERFRT